MIFQISRPRTSARPAAIVALVASVAARRREFSAACEAGEYAAWANFPRCAGFTPLLPNFPGLWHSLFQAASPQDAHQSQAFAAALVRAQQVRCLHRACRHAVPAGGNADRIFVQTVWHVLLDWKEQMFYTSFVDRGIIFCLNFFWLRHIGRLFLARL